MNFWHILELSETTDKKQIKKAYACLLKKHKPEEDPEGYQQLREAFDQAIQYVKNHKKKNTPLTENLLTTEKPSNNLNSSIAIHRIKDNLEQYQLELALEQEKIDLDLAKEQFIQEQHQQELVEKKAAQKQRLQEIEQELAKNKAAQEQHQQEIEQELVEKKAAQKQRLQEIEQELAKNKAAQERHQREIEQELVKKKAIQDDLILEQEQQQLKKANEAEQLLNTFNYFFEKIFSTSDPKISIERFQQAIDSELLLNLSHYKKFQQACLVIGLEWDKNTPFPGLLFQYMGEEFNWFTPIENNPLTHQHLAFLEKRILIHLNYQHLFAMSKKSAFFSRKTLEIRAAKLLLGKFRPLYFQFLLFFNVLKKEITGIIHYYTVQNDFDYFPELHTPTFQWWVERSQQYNYTVGHFILGVFASFPFIPFFTSYLPEEWRVFGGFIFIGLSAIGFRLLFLKIYEIKKENEKKPKKQKDYKALGIILLYLFISMMVIAFLTDEHPDYFKQNRYFFINIGLLFIVLYSIHWGSIWVYRVYLTERLAQLKITWDNFYNQHAAVYWVLTLMYTLIFINLGYTDQLWIKIMGYLSGFFILLLIFKEQIYLFTLFMIYSTVMMDSTDINIPSYLDYRFIFIAVLGYYIWYYLSQLLYTKKGYVLQSGVLVVIFIVPFITAILNQISVTIFQAIFKG